MAVLRAGLPGGMRGGWVARTTRVPREQPAPERVVWVDAVPFRAHLVHLMTVGDLSVEVVAALTGVSPRATRHLLRGRGGRPVRRISADTGRRLLDLTSADARTVRQRMVPARTVRRQIGELLADGLTAADLATRAGVDAALVDDLLARRCTVCPQLVAAQVAALHTSRGTAPAGRHRADRLDGDSWYDEAC